MYKSGLYIIIYFEQRQGFIWGFLVFSFLVFSFLSILSLIFLAIFPDLEMLKFWSVNYICQVWKVYFYFGHVRNSGQYIYLSVFSKQWRCPTFILALVKYMLCSHFTQNCIFLYFLEAKNPCFVIQNCWKSSCICVFILRKKRRNWFCKNLHNSGMVCRRKLPDPSLNGIFNALLAYNIRSHFNELILAWCA